MNDRLTDLARRLCIAHANDHATTVMREPVPCASHLDLARRYWGLVTRDTTDLRVLNEAAQAWGLEVQEGNG